MYQFLVDKYQCCKLILLLNTLVYSNIIQVQVNSVTIHESGSSHFKVIKTFLGKESLKHLLSISYVY